MISNVFVTLKFDSVLMISVFYPKTRIMPLSVASITMVHPQIIFRNLKVPILILYPVATDDPMPYEKENVALAGIFQK